VLELCRNCYLLYDEDDKKIEFSFCPVCGRHADHSDLTEVDIDSYLDITFGCKKYWAENLIKIHGISHVPFEINDLDVRKQDMKLLLMYLMGKKDDNRN